jgi:hypothetical protein
VLFRACCVLALTGLLLTVAPAAALADDAEVVPTTSTRDVEVPVGEAFRTPQRFGAVAFSGLPERALIGFRTAAEDGAWSDWVTQETADGYSDGEWVGDAGWLEVRLDGAETVTAHLIDTTGVSHGFFRKAADALRGAWRGAPAEAAVAPPLVGPAVVSRAQWGAPMPRRTPRATSTIRAAVIHHTGMSNNYSPEEAPGVVRAVHHIHANIRGWGDIGYHALVDRYGTVYEGRAGGLQRALVGAHTGGFNIGTFGISVMGTYDQARPPDIAIEAVAQMIAWKFRIHGVDAAASVRLRSNGSTSWYPKDHVVELPTIFAHRNVSNTICPGLAFYRALPELRHRVLQLTGDYFDVARSTHADGIETLIDMGIVSGCGPRSFCPDEVIKRGQFATMLARAVGAEDPGTGDAFADVATSTHAGSVNALVGAGLLDAGETFVPDEPLRRGQLATFVARAFDSVRPLELQGRRLFDDIADTPHASAIDGLAAVGLMAGCSEKSFCPSNEVTRGQAATVLARVLGLADPAPLWEA